MNRAQTNAGEIPGTVFKWGVEAQSQVSASVSKRKMQRTLNYVFQSLGRGASVFTTKLQNAEAADMLLTAEKVCRGRSECP